MTQPGGAGTDIQIYDDASSASGSGYTFAEISAAFPSDFVSNGTNKPSYRAKVSLQVGDSTTGTATTTIVDTTGATVIWDSGKTLKNRATQTTSWHYSFGTKVGSGNESSGVTGTHLVFGAATSLPGTHAHYGCVFQQTTGAMTFSTPTDAVGEMVNCLLQSLSTGTAPINIGTGSARFANVYNVDISHTTAGQVMSNFGALNAERVTVSAAAPSAFIISGGAAVLLKDSNFFGTPSLSDLRWTGTGANGWLLYRPTWTGNAAKFSNVTSGFPALNGAAVEYRGAAVKVVDRTGAGVAGIPIHLEDTLGTVVIDTTTDSAGEVSFGSGIAANMVAVMDHYVSSGTTYAQRHRSPFTMKVNTSDLTGYNSAYLSRTYDFNWPGYDSITTSAGQFEDLGDIIAIQDPAGNPTTWTELEIGA